MNAVGTLDDYKVCDDCPEPLKSPEPCPLKIAIRSEDNEGCLCCDECRWQCEQES